MKLEDHYREHLDNIQLIAIGLDAEGKIFYANPFFLQLVGLSEPQVLGTDWFANFLPERLRPQINVVFREVLEKGFHTHYDNPILLPDGRERMIKWNNTLLHGEAGNISGVMSVGEDVTEIREAARKLAESEARFRAMVTAAYDIVFVVDRSLTYRELYGKYLEVHGIRPERYLGRTVWDIYPPKEAGKHAAFLKEALAGKNVVYTFDGQLERKHAHFQAALSPLPGHDGGVNAVMGIVHDVTQVREAEALLNLLYTAINQSGEPVMVTNNKGTIVYVNSAFSKVTGYAVEEAVGHNPRFLKSGMHPAAHYRELWETIAAGKVWEGTIVNRRKDGTLYEEENIIAPVFGKTGDITHFVATKRDVTAQTLLEKARTYFTAITSHELNTPLSKLKILRVMLRDNAPERHAQLVAATDDVYNDFERIVSATTILTTLHNAGGSEHFMPVNFAAELGYCVDKARVAIEVHQRKITLDLASPGGAAMVKGEKLLLERLVDELLSNAIKYSPDGRSVAVRLRRDGENLLTEIMDEGIGVPPDVHTESIRPFFSFENPLMHSTGRYKFKGGGLGLGLTIAKMVAEYHGGSLAIALRTGREGTTVSLRLPLFRA